MNFDKNNVYSPEEDSKLLLKCVKPYLVSLDNVLGLKFCEIGVGSGFVSLNIAKEFKKIKFYGSDINKDAINWTKSEFDSLGVGILLKNKSLFDGFKRDLVFDLIVFNTPYFPFENKSDTFESLCIKDRAIYGGPKGFEVIENFVLELNSRLSNEGFCYMVYSTLTKPDEIEKILTNNLFEFEYVSEENSFFEKILCIKVWKSTVLKNLFDLKIIDLKYLSHGKHSIVLDGLYKGNTVIVKVGKPQHLDKEAFFEEKLGGESFVPKMFFKGDGFVVREKIEGDLIVDFFEIASKKDILKVLNEILKITIRLDELRITKFEMTNPYKHIYVLDDLRVKFIDFERCIFTDKPKNTTQVLEFFKRYSSMLEKKEIEIDFDMVFDISKKYKKKHFKFLITDILKN